MSEQAANPQRPVARILARLGRGIRPWLILGVVCGGFSLHPAFVSAFWTREYLPNILQQAATNVILAVGMTFVIVTGGIDLSVGSVLALSGVALGMAATDRPPLFMAALAAAPLAALAPLALRRRGRPAWTTALAFVAALILFTPAVAALVRPGAGLGVALAFGLLVGLGCGLINGAVTAYGGIPPFVATLGMLTAARGLTVFATDGNSVSGLPRALGAVGGGAPLVLVAAAVVVTGVVALSLTALGRSFLAVGGNRESARLAGIDVRRVTLFAYLASGLAAAVAAIVLTAKFGLADTGAASGAELNAIAAVVIGGTSLSGGQGSVLGSLVGALTIAVLNAGLVLIGVPDTMQGVAIGAVIVVAVLLDRIRRKGD